ncbi:girdin-like [Diorhabda sublineata]|uniref:girdin-like n=1 Tax=Diorhabda sublineata TaxID=1163346 RepID=UPI0024E0B6AC|nr:girdin-like [Diorhabda sublineata]
MDKDIPNIALDTSCCGPTMEIVMKNIYSSCDPQNVNMVPTSEIIEFIRPYLLEDLSALETLKNMLDPENKNVSVTGETFFTVMNEWTQKIASHSEDDADGVFNRTPSQLNVIDEKLLPYTQSTPRASFGQKLLNCEGLLNLSNVSSYNLSPTKQAKDISIGGPEKTILEEEVKQLQHQLNKVSSELEMLKVQLAFSEDQNEVLQEELQKCKTRLQSGQQVNEDVQENKTCIDELRDEIGLGKKRIEELNKKLTFFEKDNVQLNQYAQKLEKEIVEQEAHFAKTKQNLENEIFGFRTELEMKEHEISTFSKINDELRLKLCEKMTELEQVLTENEVLDYKQQDLEKLLSSKRYSLSSHYNSCLDEMSSFLARGNTIPIYSSPVKNKCLLSKSPLTKKVHSPTPKMLYRVLNSSTPKNCNGSGLRKSFSLNAMSTRSLPNIFCFERSNVVQDQGDGGEEARCAAVPNARPYESLQTELFQVDPQFDHKVKNGIDHDDLKNEIECLQKKIDTLEEENKVLNKEYGNVQDKAKDLERKLTNLMLEKEEIKTDKLDTVKQLEALKLDFDRLESILNVKEKKIDFEPMYKNLEKEFAKKVAQIDELQLKIKIEQNRIRNREDPVKNVDLTNEMINLRKDLQEKNTRIKQLQDILRNEGDVKRQIWLTNEDLRKNLEELREKYKKEVDKNCDSSLEISEMRIKYEEIVFKYNEQLEICTNLKNQIVALKNEADVIKENQKCYRKDTVKILTDFEQTLHYKIKELEKMKIDLENNKNKPENDNECEDSGVKSELDVEEERRNRKHTDGDASSESSLSLEKPQRLFKNRSFEKQKLTIEKLREELRLEKYKNESLKERLTIKSDDVEKLQTTINDLNNKINQQEDYYKRICIEKVNLTEELKILKGKYSEALITLNEREISLKKSQEALEIEKSTVGKLDEQLVDFKILQNKLSADLVTKLNNVTQENEKIKLLSENRIMELSTHLFKQKTDLDNYQSDLAKKDEEISCLSKVLLERDVKIQALTSAATAYDIKTFNILMELTEKEEAYLKLQNEFELLNEKIRETTETKATTLERMSTNNFDGIMDGIDGCVSEETTSDKISNFTDVISECCQELNGAFTRFIRQWKKKIESHPKFKDLPYIKLCQSLKIEDVLSVIVENIKTVIMLLDITSSKNMESLDEDNFQDFLPMNQYNSNSVDSKNIKKFTLRPATLQLSRPVSPDSPGIEISNVENEQEENGDIHTRSPDSRNVKVSLAIEREEEDEEEDNHYDRFNHLPLFSFDLRIQDAFPHLSDTLLEKLGLHENSPKVKLTKEETEEIFTAFAIQVSLDSKDIKNRLRKQKTACNQKYRKYQYLLKDISMRLRDHNCIGAKDSINPVYVLLEDVRFMMQDLMQSAGQLGVLNCELRMTKCWNLVTNYMAILKQDLEDTKSPGNTHFPVQTKSSPSPSKNSNENTKEKQSSGSNCIMWVMCVPLLLLIGVVCVHWQCKMTTEYKICPLDDFFRIISHRIGTPPY